MRFKYKYEHLPCGLCGDITDTGCPYELCPHILGNLPDLLRDPAFNAALEDAESCDTFHRPTLIMLKRHMARISERAVPGLAPPIETNYDRKLDCAACNLARTGFICDSERDGSCLKTDWDAVLQKGRMPCPA
jgi:hypothetical protein